MKPTFVRVGKYRAKTRAPLTVRPPTEADQVTRGTDCATEENLNVATHTITFPSGALAGDLALAFVNMDTKAVLAGPSGWTEEYSVGTGFDYAYLYTKTLTAADISAGSATFTTSGNDDSDTLCHYFRGIDRTGLTISGPVGMATAEHDPPAVTPTQGAGDYTVLVAFYTNKGNFPTDQDTDGPTGYTSWCSVSHGLTEPGIYTWYATKSITTSENPSEIGWTDSAGSRQYATVTIAVPAQAAAADVASGDHVHGADSASDGQVWTADGAGGAAWETLAAGDHGSLTGLTDDDHTQYILADGTRAFTGDQSMGSNKLTDVTDPTNAQDAATKAYVDSAAADYELLVASTDSTIDRFVATADKTIANTTTETTLFGTGEGNLTFPAGFFTAGKAIRVLMRGRLSDTGTPNFTIKMKLGSTVIDSVGPVALTGISDVEWMLDGLITCRSTGASGTFVGGGLFDYDDGTELSLGSGSDISIDTTASQTLDITWQWGTASASNTITVREAAVTLIDPNRDGIGGLEPVFTEAGDDYVYGLVP